MRRSSLITKLIILGITVAAQLVYLIGLWRDKDTTVIIGMLLLFFTAMFGIIFIGLQSVLTLHRDMNTKQSYMLFMTPNSCYKILGAKMLENFLSMLLGGVFFFGLGALDVSLLVKHFPDLGSFMDAFRGILRMFNIDLGVDASYLASLCFGMLSSWFAIITAAFLADIVSSALLNGKKFNLLISFILFLARSYLMGKVSGAISAPAMQARAAEMPKVRNRIWLTLIPIMAALWALEEASSMHLPTFTLVKKRCRPVIRARETRMIPMDWGGILRPAMSMGVWEKRLGNF